jgi:two-component system sensor histidine kinase QseC
MSLSGRLLAGLALACLGYSALVALLTVRDSAVEIQELFDAHLAQTALALLRVADPDEADPVHMPAVAALPPTLEALMKPWSELPERLARLRPGSAAALQAGPGTLHSMHDAYERTLRYQVWDRSGRLLLRSANAPDGAIADSDGYSDSQDVLGRAWRHFGVWDQHHDFRILVSEAKDLRNGVVRGMALQAASPLAMGLPLLLLLIWWSVNRGLGPLVALTRQLESRKSDNLVPLDADRAPHEVRSMVHALNALLHRVAHALEGERRFTANAAHELRTPLAAIQVHLHAVRHAADDADRGQAMSQLQHGVERAIRVVGQVLTLARLDPDHAWQDPRPIDLCRLAETVCADLAPLALQRGQTLELALDSDVPAAHGNPDLLAMLLANLVDNAIRYSDPGGHIDVAVRRIGTLWQLEIADNGPGIPHQERERVFEQFFRIAGQDREGTGLGLAISRRVADLHQARITLADRADGPGLLVRVAPASLAATPTTVE